MNKKQIEELKQLHDNICQFQETLKNMTLYDELYYLDDIYADRMKECHKIKDIEDAHGKADNLLVELLEWIGFEKVVKEYKKVPKWYA